VASAPAWPTAILVLQVRIRGARTSASAPGVMVPDATAPTAEAGGDNRTVSLPIAVARAGVTGTSVITALTRPFAVTARS
jgi:hypothetical protein